MQFLSWKCAHARDPILPLEMFLFCISAVPTSSHIRNTFTLVPVSVCAHMCPCAALVRSQLFLMNLWWTMDITTYCNSAHGICLFCAKAKCFSNEREKCTFYFRLIHSNRHNSVATVYPSHGCRVLCMQNSCSTRTERMCNLVCSTAIAGDIIFGRFIFVSFVTDWMRCISCFQFTCNLYYVSEWNRLRHRKSQCHIVALVLVCRRLVTHK